MKKKVRKNPAVKKKTYKRKKRNNPAWKKIIYALVSNEPRIHYNGNRFDSASGVKDHEFGELILELFPDCSPDGAKSKLSNTKKSLFETFERYGGVTFIDIDNEEKDKRRKRIGINDDKLKIWLNSLFNFHFKEMISGLHHLTYSERDLFKLIKVNPRILLLHAITGWEAPQFPSKEHLSRRIYEYVSAEYIRKGSG